jgi:hypothetical protein
MADNQSLGDVFYGPSGPASAPVGPREGIISGGKAGSAPATARGTDSGGQSALADIFYGGGEDPGMRQARATINAPGTSWRGESLDSLPQEASRDWVSPPEQREPRSFAEALYGRDVPAEIEVPVETGEPAADTETRHPATEQELVEEFESFSDDLGLDAANRKTLMSMHVKAAHDAHSRTVSEWRQEAERTFAPAQLSSIRRDFDQRLGSDATANQVRHLLSWSGLGSNAQFIKGLSRLMGRR